MSFVEAIAAAAPEAVPRADSRPTSSSMVADRRRDILVAGAAIAAGCLALFADGAATGTSWWDAVLRFCVAAMFTVAMSAGRPEPTIVAATLAAAFVGLGGWFPAALVALAGSIARVQWPGRRRELGAGAGALAVQALLRLPEWGFFGLQSLVAGTAIVLVLLGAYHELRPRAQRRARLLGLSLAVTVVALVLVAAAAALSIRNEAELGISAARRGLDAARAGESSQLVAELERAEVELASVDRGLGRAVLRPLRLVPVVAQHHRALSVAAEQGATVAGEAARTARDADIDEIRFRRGELDLGRLAAMAPQLSRTADLLADAGEAIEGQRTGWLLPQLDDRLSSLAGEIDDVLPEARLSAEAAAVLPAMLGADGPRRYMVLFGSPGETRELGGFVGGYALIEFDRGGLTLVESGRPNDLFERSRAESLDDPAGYPTEFLAADPATFPQNLTATPNISVVARAVRDLFPTLAGAPIDGVVYADPFAVEAMIRLTGPISIAGRDEPLDGDNFSQFIFEDQYRLFDERGQTYGAIEDVVVAAVQAIEEVDLPGPERIGEVFGPVARGGRLQMATFDGSENGFLASVHLHRDFRAPLDADALALVQTNATASKLDLYLQREVDYLVAVDEAGALSATVDVTLRSTIAADVPPYTIGDTDGTNRVLLSLYSPHELVDLSVDGRPHEYVVQREYGFFRYALFSVPVPANGTVAVRFALAGRIDADRYRLAVWQQPLVNDDVVRIAYTDSAGSTDMKSLELVENWLYQAPD